MTKAELNKKIRVITDLMVKSDLFTNEYDLADWAYEIIRRQACKRFDSIPAPLLLEHLSKGTQIIYVPVHANHNPSHPDCEAGFVMGPTEDDKFVFCRYWNPWLPGELRTVANSESTPLRNLVKQDTVPQEVVDAAIIQIERSRSVMEKFPKYACIGAPGGATLRLISAVGGLAEYHRDAGVWNVNAKIIDGRLMFESPYLYGKKGIFDIPGYAATREAWAKDNEGYI